jgi:hypothetical protein
MDSVIEQPQTKTDWDALVAGARIGDVEMCFSLQERLKPGIRVLLARKPLRSDEDTAVAAVLSSVVEGVRGGAIANASELARAARAAIADHVAARRPMARETSTASPTTALDAHLSARERDMLRRFYVLAQEPVEICRAMGVTMEDFMRAKSLARAAVAVSLAARRQTGTAGLGARQ